jgi:hypothetical protein
MSLVSTVLVTGVTFIATLERVPTANDTAVICSVSNSIQADCRTPWTVP